jgi:deoxyribonuclease V
MIACLDVAYSKDVGRAACVLLRDWSDATAAEEHVTEVVGVAEYEPGQFYRRELPCLLAVLKQLATVPEVIVVDGYVWLGDGVPGLGGRLHAALGGTPAIVGVAKTCFVSAPAVPVLRGGTRRPLFVTANGMDVAEAANHVQAMHGAYRIPTALRRVDQLCRGRVSTA